MGANKSREFIIKHNNITSRELHDLGENDLAIVVDGTYTRLEKSSNNEFQYLCWSQQKMDLLIKPFIICCTDGYFIDCYGPFQANQNDKSILEYILKNDKKLNDILQPPNDTYIFLDRGFRDIFTDLKNQGFKVYIPTCFQLENRTEETENDQDDEYAPEKEKMNKKNINNNTNI